MKKKLILIVEDEMLIANSLKEIIKEYGYEVTDVIPTGEGAVAKVSEIPPDLILMDIMLEGEMDGIEATRKIQENFDIPVIYLTAYATNEVLERAKVIQPSGFILKPVEDRELYANIELAFYKHKMKMRLKDSEEKFHKLIEKENDGVVIIQNNLIKYANPSFAVLVGRTVDEVIGTQFYDYIHNKELPKLLDYKKLHDDGKVIDKLYNTIIIDKKNVDINVEINMGEISYNGKPTDLIFIKDINKHKII